MQHLINSSEFTGIITLLTIFSQIYPIWCGLVPIYQSVFFLVSTAGHRNVCTEVKIRNVHSSCMLSIFERQCHRQSKVLLHWRDVLSLYQSNRGPPPKPLSHFLKFSYTYILLQTYAGFPTCTCCWCIWQFHLRCRYPWFSDMPQVL